MSRPPRAIAGALAFALVAAACSGSTGTAPTSSSSTATTTTIAGATNGPEIPVFADDGESIGTDDAVRIGVLDNELTYYIRENDSPGGRAQLRLAVDVGSLEETDDQHGAAHFLEHMMFNGTERFPAHELVLLLQRFGAEFGPDINAYTSYEETVYELELPTDDAATLQAGFDVLYEWATAAALDPEEIDLERGVLVEEWRLRDQNFWGRYFEGVTEVLLADTPYADRGTLADPDQVAATTEQGLREFYERWYRPDTMAVVAVGDFDADVIEQMIFERFAEIPSADGADPVPAPATEPASEPSFFIIADPEYPQAWAELNYPLPVIGDKGTVGAVRQGIAFDLAWTMIVNRLEEQSLLGSAPFFDPSFAANPLVRTQRSPGLAAFAHPEQLGAAAEALLGEVARAEAHGFLEGELQRALDEVRGDVELAYDERGTTQDADYADDYVEHFLDHTPIPSAAEWHDLRLRLLDEITADQVWATFASTIATTEPFVIIVAPQAASDVIPSEAELRDIVTKVEATEYEPWNDEAATLETLMDRPATTPVVSRGRFSDSGLTVLTLTNQARVVFFPTSIRNDVIVFTASSPGGWATVPPEDAAEAQLAPRIAINSGVGDIDQVSLDRTLSGTVLSLVPFINEVHEGFTGEVATRDLETLLALTSLYMTRPRFEQTALDIAVAQDLPFAADPGLVPNLAVQQALADARFAGDRRFAPLASAEDLETLDLTRAAEIYRDRFDDPGDFVFVIAGDFDQSIAEDLARRYLGTIPGPGEVEGFTDLRPDPPAAIVERTVEAGTGELGGATFLFSTPVVLDPPKRIETDLLELVLQQRLTKRIREELSASYSPFAVAEVVDEPEQSVELRLQISGDPGGLDDVITATLEEISDLRDNGPTTDELAIAQQQLLRDYELVSNEGLSQAVIFSAEHPDEPLTQVVDRIDHTFDATGDDLRGLAIELLPEDRYILVRLVPVGFDG